MAIETRVQDNVIQISGYVSGDAYEPLKDGSTERTPVARVGDFVWIWLAAAPGEYEVVSG